MTQIGDILVMLELFWYAKVLYSNFVKKAIVNVARFRLLVYFNYSVIEPKVVLTT